MPLRAKLACIFLAYVLGSIPFGYLIVRLTAGGDVRDTGSGGTGATNVSRRAGKAAGVLTLILDALKGAGAIALARIMFGRGAFSIEESGNAGWWIATAGVLAILGHCFPIWLRFRGGKGVATGTGVFLMLAPLSLLGATVIFLLIVVATRYVSLGSIAAAASVPIFVLLLQRYSSPTLIAAVCGSLLIIFMHKTNISRLRAGTENKLR